MNPRHTSTFFKRLYLRELSNKGNRQFNRRNSFRDYHFREFEVRYLDLAGSGITYGTITDMAIAGDIICIIYCQTHLIPFTRNGEISVCKDDSGTMIVNHWGGDIKFVCYNNINNSLLTVVSVEGFKRIISTEIESIKSGRDTEGRRELFPNESIDDWNLDVANCRGMVCNAHEKVWKVFELKNYTRLFTLPYASYTKWFPGKPDMVLYDIRMGYWGRERSFKIYRKLDGRLKKQFIVRGSKFEFVTPCGNNRLILQQRNPEGMQIYDTSAEIGQLIKSTYVRSLWQPFYLEKRRQFICKTDNLHRSGSVTSTSRYSVDVYNLEGERLFTFRDLPDSSAFPFITKNQDVAISVSAFPVSININSILTGDSLANIRVNDAMTTNWDGYGIKRFEYDERTHEMFMLNYIGYCCIWSNKPV